MDEDISLQVFYLKNIHELFRLNFRKLCNIVYDVQHIKKLGRFLK